MSVVPGATTDRRVRFRRRYSNLDDAMADTVSPALSAFYFFADTPRRRAALHAEPGSAERYVLYGLDQERLRGVSVAHNLERGAPPRWARLADRAVNGGLRRLRGTGGDLAPALACLRQVNRADVVVATIDRMGIPLTLLARAGLLRTALVYVSVGLPERLERLHGPARRLHLAALRRVDVFVAYSAYEAEMIREGIGSASGARVVFVPFGVDTVFFHPAAGEPDAEVVSVGADPHRDYPLLLRIAARHPDWRFRLVVAPEQARVLGAVAPPNVQVEAGISFEDVRERLARGRVVALPVRDNSYSGATTVLLQALASGRPVVVSRTAAIETGYGLRDGVNCLLVPTGDEDAFELSLQRVAGDPGFADALGVEARSLAESLCWQRYADAMHDVLADAVARHSSR